MINLTITAERKVYHDYYKPLICSADSELPKIINVGYNTYEFIDKPTFNVNGLTPYCYNTAGQVEEPRRYGKYVEIYEHLEVHTPSGKTTQLTYFRVIDTTTGQTVNHRISP